MRASTQNLELLDWLVVSLSQILRMSAVFSPVIGSLSDHNSFHTASANSGQFNRLDYTMVYYTRDSSGCVALACDCFGRGIKTSLLCLEVYWVLLYRE